MSARLVALAIVAVAVSATGCRKRTEQAVQPFQILTETSVVRVGEPLPSRSPIFDGEQVSLRGVRGETLSFVVAFATARTSPRVALSVLGDGVTIESFVLEPVPVLEASSALFGPSRGPGRYPDRLVSRASKEPVNQIIFDIAIGKDAPSGARSGTLTINDITVALHLEILPYSIELARSPLVWVWYRRDDLATREDELEYQALFLEHGALLATDPRPDELEDRRAEILPSALYWPVSVRANSAEDLADNTRAVVEFFATLSATPFSIPIDEPADDAAREAVVVNGRVIGEAGGGPKTLIHAVTDYRRPIYGDAVDVFISPAAIFEEVPEQHQRWTYNGRPPRAGNMTIDSRGGSLRSWGWIAFRYRVELWYAWHGLYWTDRYNGAESVTDMSKSMLTFDQRRKDGRGDYGNGDGVLAYPGAQPSLRLKALRRGLQDRLLLARLSACGGGDRAQAIARATVPKALGEAGAYALWPRDESGWELARDSVLDALVVACPPE